MDEQNNIPNEMNASAAQRQQYQQKQQAAQQNWQQYQQQQAPRQQYQQNQYQQYQQQQYQQQYQQPQYRQPPVYPGYNVSPDQLPPQYRPLSAWAYFGYSLLFCVPLVGFICLIVFSINDSNLNRRSFARSYWCWFIIAAVVILILALTGGLAAYGAYRYYY